MIFPIHRHTRLHLIKRYTWQNKKCASRNQQGKDFSPYFTNAKLKDEISLAWQDVKGQWNILKVN